MDREAGSGPGGAHLTGAGPLRSPLPAGGICDRALRNGASELVTMRHIGYKSGADFGFASMFAIAASGDRNRSRLQQLRAQIST